MRLRLGTLTAIATAAWFLLVTAFLGSLVLTVASLPPDLPWPTPLPEASRGSPVRVNGRFVTPPPPPNPSFRIDP